MSFDGRCIEPVSETWMEAARIEPAVWDVVAACCSYGVRTRSSCEGHSSRDLPYVMFGVDYADAAPAGDT